MVIVLVTVVVAAPPLNATTLIVYVPGVTYKWFTVSPSKNDTGTSLATSPKYTLNTVSYNAFAETLYLNAFAGSAVKVTSIASGALKDTVNALVASVVFPVIPTPTTLTL